MKKFTPSIVIWNLELCDKEDGIVLQNLYFLSYKRAKKFWKKARSRIGRIQGVSWRRTALVVVNKITILNGGFDMRKYVIYGVTQDELDILEREGFEFIEELPYLGSKTWNIMFECDKQYFDMALNAIRRN